MKIIAFTGNKQSGKTESYNELKKIYTDAVYKLSFAEPVKKIAREQFGWDGKKDKKGRKLLQLIGTEVGRGYNSNIWVEKMEKILKNINYSNVIVIIDDLRFDNEAELIKKWNGIIIKIKRPEYNGDGHASEKGISNKYIDYIIYNDGTIEQLKNRLLETTNNFLNNIKEKQNEI